jgi:class 3 adenylate cyclase/tetratricopeptide (TPR) repeat protein
VDLVGFTERSDRADPEDVRRTLVPFHARVKEDLERFGGTLDKFIGDAVLGVFGAPVAHEDDPARAVHAGLRILESIEDLRRTVDPDIAVRIAVNTGEAVVSFGTGPQVGEAVAGDVVNTASRMQGLAPRDSVVIGEQTLRSVADRFDAEQLPPAMVKGKAEPITVWKVTGVRTTDEGGAPTRFVGRATELAALEELFEATTATSSARLVLVVGEAGIGKSRLVSEFRLRTEDRSRWLEGRCLPYGEAVTFAPVASMVRQVAGIGPEDEPDQARTKLRSLAERIEADPAERDWLLSRLGPVLGIETAAGDAETIAAEETAHVWARVVLASEPSAPKHAIVLHVDDLYWAEPVLLEVIGDLVRALADQPVLILGATRPDVPGSPLTDGELDAATVTIGSLSEEESAELLTDLVPATAMTGSDRDMLLERAGGNPLYALEFARMLAERGDTAPTVRTSALPHTVRAVIGARLDAIPRDLRALILDASVLGSAFWPGALGELGGRADSEVRTGIDALVRRGLVQPSGRSTFEDEPEYGFAHGLVGEVAHARIPRADRARRHLAAGRWIERASGERSEERSEMLARHFAAAVELASAAGERSLAESAREPATRFLLMAGGRAARLDPASAFELFDRARQIAEAGTEQLAAALTLSAHLGRRSGRLEGKDILPRYSQALAIYRQLGDWAGEGRTLVRVGSQLGAMGEFARSRQMFAEAVAVLKVHDPGPDLARAYAYQAEAHMLAGDVDESMSLADRALHLLASGGQEEIVVMALHIRGDAQCAAGDLRGLDDLQEALRVAEAAGSAADVITSHDYLGEWRWQTDGPRAGLRHVDAALAMAERRGVRSSAAWTKAGALEMLMDAGEWDQAHRWCEELIAQGPENLDPTLMAVARTVRSRIALLRGRQDDTDPPKELVALARQVEELHAMAPALAVAAELAAARGDSTNAAAFVEEFDRVTRDAAPQYRESRLAALARVCVKIGRVDLGQAMFDRSQGLVRRDRLNVLSAMNVLASRRHPLALLAQEEVAREWHEFGNPFEEGVALRGLARVLRVIGEAGGAEEARARADALLVPLGVDPASI